MVAGQGNTLIYQEFNGPPDDRHYPAGFDVYAAAFIMADGVLPPWLIAFAGKIRMSSEIYGGRCWALLYQTADRFLHAHMPRMMRRENDKPGRMIKAGGPLDLAMTYNPATPSITYSGSLLRWKCRGSQKTGGGAPLS